MKKMILYALLCLHAQESFGHSWINEMSVFLYSAMTNFQSVGAVAPFSKATAQRMVRPIQEQLNARKPGEIFKLVEVGAGTGALTKHFIDMLDQTGVRYHLDLVELNPTFCAILQEKFKDNPHVSIHCADITRWQSKHEYHALISTLPFNCKDFSPHMIDAILKAYESMVKHDGIMLSVEYIMVGNLSKLIWTKRERQIYKEKHEIFNDFKKRHNAKKEVVMANIPPTYVFTLKINKENPTIDA